MVDPMAAIVAGVSVILFGYLTVAAVAADQEDDDRAFAVSVGAVVFFFVTFVGSMARFV